MRLSEFLKTPSFVILAVFIATAAFASFVPSPWRDDALLKLTPKLPAGLEQHIPLIVWPERTGASSDHFHIDLDLENEDETSDNLEPRERSQSPLPSKAEAMQSAQTPPSASETTDAAASHDNAEHALTLREDRALLASLQKLQEQLPKRRSLLVIPCVEHVAGDTSIPTDNIEGAPCERYALDNFYASLRERALGKKGHTRWMQYGDSLVIGDTFTAELRRLLQRQFGDGGHGWLYIGRPLRPVGAENIRAYPTDEWYVRTIVRNTDDAGDLFGLGGAEFRATDGSHFIVRPPRDGEFGGVLKNFQLYYFAPSDTASASFKLRVDSKTHTEHITTQPGSSGVHSFVVSEDTREVQLSNFSQKIRYYGLVSEKDAGVVVDNFGLVSAREEHLLKINPDQWHDQLALRDPDVVAFFYGVNAASSDESRMRARTPSYIENYQQVIERAMRGASSRDCVVLSLLTRGDREGSKVVPTGAVDVLNQAQKRAALASGCAFFDTTGVMGGSKGTEKWTQHKPPLLGADLSHPTRAGHHIIARHLYSDLIAGFIEYLTRRIPSDEVTP